MKALIAAFIGLLHTYSCQSQVIFFANGKKQVAMYEQRNYTGLFILTEYPLGSKSQRFFIQDSSIRYTTKDSTASICFNSILDMSSTSMKYMQNVVIVSKDSKRKAKTWKYYQNDLLQAWRKEQPHENDGSISEQYKNLQTGEQYFEQHFPDAIGRDTLNIFTKDAKTIVTKSKYYDTGEWSSVFVEQDLSTGKMDTGYVEQYTQKTDTVLMNTSFLPCKLDDCFSQLFASQISYLKKLGEYSFYDIYLIYSNNTSVKLSRDRKHFGGHSSYFIIQLTYEIVHPDQD